MAGKGGSSHEPRRHPGPAPGSRRQQPEHGDPGVRRDDDADGRRRLALESSRAPGVTRARPGISTTATWAPRSPHPPGRRSGWPAKAGLGVIPGPPRDLDGGNPGAEIPASAGMTTATAGEGWRPRGSPSSTFGPARCWSDLAIVDHCRVGTTGFGIFPEGSHRSRQQRTIARSIHRPARRRRHTTHRRHHGPAPDVRHQTSDARPPAAPHTHRHDSSRERFRRNLARAVALRRGVVYV